MAGINADITRGIVEISHITGAENKEIPSRKMDKPSPGSNIEAHTVSALNLEDSDNHIQKFIRGSVTESYSPQDQKDLRSSVLNSFANQLSNSNLEDGAIKVLKDCTTLLQEDETLEQMATMARNVLISV